jgi:ribonuclease P protein component
VRAVFATRVAAGGASLVVHLRPRGDEQPARGTVVGGRRIGSAVARNRVKRRLRAALHEVALPAGTDVVVVGRAPALTASYPELRAELESRLRSAAAKVPA